MNLNLRLCTDIFSDNVKEARAVSFYKGGDATDMNNYRSTFMLPTVSFLFLKMVLKQKYTYSIT